MSREPVSQIPPSQGGSQGFQNKYHSRPPQYNVSSSSDHAHSHGTSQQRVFLCTEEWPFSGEQFDVDVEAQLVNSRIDPGDDVPLLKERNFREIHLQPYSVVARELQEWDQKCVQKHLAAISKLALPHEEVTGLLLAPGEEVVETLELVGINNAPGVYNSLSQRCRLTWTSKKRMIFTQASHTAEVGVPEIGPCSLICPCMLSRHSMRKWSSYYASIKAEEVLQVFTQQSMSTTYDNTPCNFSGICEECCAFGGFLRSHKTTDEMTQTLGDHDQRSECMKKWRKTRFMRQSLVIRYVDTAKDQVVMTEAMLDPNESAYKLFNLAKEVEGAKTLTMEKWLAVKTRPRAGIFGAFSNDVTVPFFTRTGYRAGLIGLYVLSLIISLVTVNVLGGFFLFLGVTIALSGSFHLFGGRAKEMMDSTKSIWSTPEGYSQIAGGAVYVIGLLASFV